MTYEINPWVAFVMGSVVLCIVGYVAKCVIELFSFWDKS